MMGPSYMLSALPFEELLKDVQLILDHDDQELKNQTAYLQQLQREKKKSQAYLDRFEARLEHAHTRHEFVNQLLCRCQTYHFRCIAMALERAEKEAIEYGKTNNYGVILSFHGNTKPEIIPF